MMAVTTTPDSMAIKAIHIDHDKNKIDTNTIGDNSGRSRRRSTRGRSRDKKKERYLAKHGENKTDGDLKKDDQNSIKAEGDGEMTLNDDSGSKRDRRSRPRSVHRRGRSRDQKKSDFRNKGKEEQNNSAYPEKPIEELGKPIKGEMTLNDRSSDLDVAAFSAILVKKSKENRERRSCSPGRFRGKSPGRMSRAKSPGRYRGVSPGKYQSRDTAAEMVRRAQQAATTSKTSTIDDPFKPSLLQEGRLATGARKQSKDILSSSSSHNRRHSEKETLSSSSSHVRRRSSKDDPLTSSSSHQRRHRRSSEKESLSSSCHQRKHSSKDDPLTSSSHQRRNSSRRDPLSQSSHHHRKRSSKDDHLSSSSHQTRRSSRTNDSSSSSSHRRTSPLGGDADEKSTTSASSVQPQKCGQKAVTERSPQDGTQGRIVLEVKRSKSPGRLSALGSCGNNRAERGKSPGRLRNSSSLSQSQHHCTTMQPGRTTGIPRRTKSLDSPFIHHNNVEDDKAAESSDRSITPRKPTRTKSEEPIPSFYVANSLDELFGDSDDEGDEVTDPFAVTYHNQDFQNSENKQNGTKPQAAATGRLAGRKSSKIGGKLSMFENLSSHNDKPFSFFS